MALLIPALPALLRSQEPGKPVTTAPVVALEQMTYRRASDAEAYDHFGCGGGNPGHTGNSIALSGDASTMAVGTPSESGGAAAINGNQDDNSAYASGAVFVSLARAMRGHGGRTQNLQPRTERSIPDRRSC